MPRTIAALLNGTGGKVNVPSVAALDNLDPWTMIWWFYRTASTGGRNFFGKGENVGSTRRIECHTNGTTNIQVALDRATVDLAYTSGSVIPTLNQYYCLAVSFNSANAANTLVKGYVGSLVAPLTPFTFGTTTDGSGAFQSDAGVPLVFMNLSSNAATLPGALATAHLLAEESSLGTLLDLQFRPFRRRGTTKGMWAFGWNGTGIVTDLSGNGNHGTITSATPSTANLPRVSWAA